MRADLPQRTDYSAEEAFRLSPEGRWELIDGRFVFMSPAGARHGQMVARVSRKLAEVVEARGLGVVLAGDVGFVLRRKPDAVRAPDVAFVRASRLPSGLPSTFFEGAPDLAVEVMSPADGWPDVARKAEEFLAAGSLAIWALDPETRTARVYSRDGERRYGADDVLSCPALLADFALPLAELWPALA